MSPENSIINCSLSSSFIGWQMILPLKLHLASRHHLTVSNCLWVAFLITDKPSVVGSHHKMWPQLEQIEELTHNKLFESNERTSHLDLAISEGTSLRHLIYRVNPLLSSTENYFLVTKGSFPGKAKNIFLPLPQYTENPITFTSAHLVCSKRLHFESENFFHC